MAASWRVELPELSSLALRGRAGGASQELLGVGDRSFSISVGEAHPPGTGAVSADLTESVRPWMSEPGGKSQWEGLAADGAGYAFVLQEHPGRASDPSHVFAFAPSLDERVGVIALVVDGDGSWEEAWRDDRNARGEALVLLRGGHILVAKQKKPVRFIEFGPRGERPVGLGPSRFLDTHESFERSLDPEVEFEPLSSWGLASEDRDDLEGVNDLAVFGGELFAISRKSHVIVQLETHATPDEDNLSVQRRWLVSTDVENPEGLAIGGGAVPIVADDVSGDEDRGGPNVHVLGRLDRD